MKQTTRILLPFTQDLDMSALEYAVQFVRRYRAILVPLVLLPLGRQGWSHEPRLEAIEQATDFLEAVRYKAARARVPVASSDMRTRDVARSIRAFAQEMMCEGILLFFRGNQTVLLPLEVVKCLLQEAPCKRYLVRFQPAVGTGRLPMLLRRCLNWRRPQRGASGDGIQRYGSPIVPVCPTAQ